MMKTCSNLEKEYEELKQQYDDLNDCYGEMEKQNTELQNKIYDLEDELLYYKEGENTIYDLELFKSRLEIYGLANKELYDFIDLYMKLYNKE